MQFNPLGGTRVQQADDLKLNIKFHYHRGSCNLIVSVNLKAGSFFNTDLTKFTIFSSFLEYLNSPIAIKFHPFHKTIDYLLFQAHTTQFTEIGWRYTGYGEGVGPLPEGGTYVTLISPDRKDLTIVVETMVRNRQVLSIERVCVYVCGCV